MIYYILKMCIALFIHTIVWAEICIDITQGINAFPIAIIPFYNINNTTLNIDNIANIISSDLQNTGKFNFLSISLFPEEPHDISHISVKKWLDIGINMLIIGNINIINNNYIILYQLINISENEIITILENQYVISKKWIRYAAHTISNDIYEKLIGIKGAFCTRIAYIVRSENTQCPYKLYVSDYDGHNEILIYHSEGPLMSPVWSPSGDQLAYVVFINNRSVIVLHDLNLGIIRELISFPRHNGAPAFSYDGEKLAFVLSKTGSLNLYIMDLISNKIQQVTNERNNNTEPNWYPDNEHLLYTSDRGGTPQIYKININNINIPPKRLSWLNYKNQNGIISSDGKFLIMISSDGNTQNITKLNLLNGEYQKLTNSLLDETPTLSPNDNMIIYSTFEGKNYKLYLLSINGRYKIQLPIDHEQIRFPSWSSYIE